MAEDDRFEANSFPFIVFGTILLFVSWLFFNGGSTFTMFGPRANSSPKIMMVTIIAGMTGGLVAAFLKPFVMRTYSKRQRYDVGALSNGILAGLVAITGVCDRCEAWSACIIGFLGGVVYVLACKLMDKLGVDDPIEATQVHGFNGVWGLIAVGIFDNQKGLVSDNPEKGSFFGWQLIGMVTIIAWTAVFSLIYFAVMNKLNLLRVPRFEEIVGLDSAEMGTKVRVEKDIGGGLKRAVTMNFHHRGTIESDKEMAAKQKRIADLQASLKLSKNEVPETERAFNSSGEHEAPIGGIEQVRQ